MSGDRKEMNWRGNKLTYRDKTIEIVEDPTYKGMWRIKYNGKTSDMVNKSRAKDAAASIILKELNDED